MGTRCRTGWNSPERRGADGLGGRVGRDQRRVVGLELPQLADQEVVLGVGDLRRVERVVALVVVLDQLAQLGRPGRRRLPPRHAVVRPRSPRSGGDAGADHGVGVGDVVEGHRLPGRHRALGRVEPDDQAVLGLRSTAQAAGRPWALTWATAGRRAAAAGRPR